MVKARNPLSSAQETTFLLLAFGILWALIEWLL